MTVFLLPSPQKGAEHDGPQINSCDQHRRHCHRNGRVRDAAGATASRCHEDVGAFPGTHGPVAFDKYYFEQHMPLTRDVKGVRFETSKVQPGASGTAPAFYRLTELYFESPEHMRAALSSPELKKVFQDAQKFQPPGTTVLISRIE